MIHLGDSNVDDFCNMDFENEMFNLPSPISLQTVNSNSRSYKPGYSKHCRFNDTAIWLKASRKRRQLFRNEFVIPEEGFTAAESWREAFKRIGEEASFRIRKMCQQIIDESDIPETVYINDPVANIASQSVHVDADTDLQFDKNYNTLSRQVLSAFGYNSFMAPKYLSSSLDSNPIVDFSTLEGESVPVPVAIPHSGIQTRILAGQTSLGQVNIIRRVRCIPTRRVGFASSRFLGEV